MDNPFTTPVFWQAHTGLFLAVIGAFALVVGSFLNVVILRLPVMLDRAWRRECSELLATSPIGGSRDEPFTLASPPSHCPGCARPIRPWENIPLLSYALLRGRCAGCRMRIPLRYPLVESLCAAASLVVALHFGVTWITLAALLLTWSLLALAVIDLDHQLLPDGITLPMLWSGLLLNTHSVFASPTDAVLGAAGGYLSLWSVYWAFRLVTGKEGMGYGDFKLLAALGAWLGWQALPAIVVVSSGLGAVIGGAWILLSGRRRNVTIPFGPFLAISGWTMLLWGDSVKRAWLP